jgi:hypothetical protein
MAGFDLGETVTWPSLADLGLQTAFNDARLAMFTALQTGQPAPRYKLVTAGE